MRRVGLGWLGLGWVQLVELKSVQPPYKFNAGPPNPPPSHTHIHTYPKLFTPLCHCTPFLGAKHVKL